MNSNFEIPPPNSLVTARLIAIDEAQRTAPLIDEFFGEDTTTAGAFVGALKKLTDEKEYAAATSLITRFYEDCESKLSELFLESLCGNYRDYVLDQYSTSLADLCADLIAEYDEDCDGNCEECEFYDDYDSEPHCICGANCEDCVCYACDDSDGRPFAVKCSFATEGECSGCGQCIKENDDLYASYDVRLLESIGVRIGKTDWCDLCKMLRAWYHNANDP